MNPRIISPLFWVTILGAIKLVLDAAGLQIIPQEKINDLADGIAAALAVIGIIIDHGKPQTIVPAPTTVATQDTINP